MKYIAAATATFEADSQQEAIELAWWQGEADAGWKITSIRTADSVPAAGRSARVRARFLAVPYLGELALRLTTHHGVWHTAGVILPG